MGVCSAFECNNNSQKKITSDTSFHNFPKDKLILKQWISFCRRKDPINPKTARLCSLHFVADDFINNIKYEMGFTARRKLKPGAVPRLHVCEPIADVDVPGPATNSHKCSRSKRMAFRKNKEVVEGIMDNLNQVHSVDPDSSDESEKECYALPAESAEYASNKDENDPLLQADKFHLEEMAKEMCVLKEQMKKLANENCILKKTITELKTLLQKSNYQKGNMDKKLFEIV